MRRRPVRAGRPGAGCAATAVISGWSRAEVPRPNLGFAEVHQFASFAHLLALGDNDTATLALSVHDEDPVLRRARHPEAFTALAAANPAFARWHAVLEPISPVFCLGALDNRLRYLAENGGPHVLGLVQVGDALAMTNPTRGRGVAMGLAAAGRLHDLLVTGETGVELALAYDALGAARARGLLPRDGCVRRRTAAAVPGRHCSVTRFPATPRRPSFRRGILLAPPRSSVPRVPTRTCSGCCCGPRCCSTTSGTSRRHPWSATYGGFSRPRARPSQLVLSPPTV